MFFRLCPLSLVLILGAVGTSADPTDSLPSLENDREFLRALAPKSVDLSEVARLLAKLEEPDFHTREKAFAKLAGLPHIPDELLSAAEKSAGPESAHRIAAIRKALADKGWAQRSQSLLHRISESKTPGFVREIVAALPNFESVQLETLAYDTLEKSATLEDADFLSAAFDSENAALRASIIAIFARLGGSDSIPLLRRGLADPDPGIRLHAALTLGKKADPASVLTMIGLLETPSVVSRHRVAGALRQMTGQHFEFDPIRPAPGAVAIWKDWYEKTGGEFKLRAYEPPIPLDLLANGLNGWRYFNQSEYLPPKDPFSPGLALANDVMKMAGKPAFGMTSISSGVLMPLKAPGYLRPPDVFTDFHLKFEYDQVARASDPFAGFVHGRKGGLGPGAIHFSSPDAALVVAVGNPARGGKFSGIRIQLNNAKVDFLGELGDLADKGEIKMEQGESKITDPISGLRTGVLPENYKWRKIEIVLAGGTLQVFKNGGHDADVTVSGIPIRPGGILFEQKSTDVSIRHLRLLPFK